MSDEPQTSGRRATLASLLLLLTTLVASLGAVEGLLRLYAPTAETSLARALRADPYAVGIEPHGDAGFRPRPHHVVAYANGTSATINADRHRGPRVEVPKPHGVFRIVLLGGSTTFGWGVDDDETIDAHLRTLLDSRFPGRSIEVVNLAFDGYDSYQLLERMRTDGVRLDPDVVLVNSGVNDVRGAWYRDLRDGDGRTMLYQATLDQLRLEQKRGGPTPWTRAKHTFYLARVPGWVTAQARGTNGGAAELPPEYYFDAVDHFEHNLDRIAELADELGAVVLFSTPPSSLLTKYEPDTPRRLSYWLYDARSTQAYRDSLGVRMRRLVEERHESGSRIGYVPHDPLEPELFLDDAHLTSAGNERVARGFLEALIPFVEAWDAEELRASG